MTVLPLSAIGGAKAEAVAKSKFELDVQIAALAELSEKFAKRADTFNFGTPAFRNAKLHLDSAWRNLQFARQQFDL